MPERRRTPLSRRAFLARGALASTGLALGGIAAPRLARLAVASPLPRTGGAEALAALTPVLKDAVRLIEKRAPYAAAFAMDRITTSINVDDQTAEIDEVFPAKGVVLTAHNGAWFEEAATTDLNPDRILALARALADRVKPREGGVAIDPGATREASFATPCQIDPRALPLSERFERIRELRARARASDETLVNCQAGYFEQVANEIFVNRKKALRQSVLRLRVNVSFWASDGQRTAFNFTRRGGTGGLEILEIPDDELAGAAADASRLVEARPVEPGRYTIVVDPSVAGTIAHESFGHGVELDMFVKDRALAERFVDRRVGSDLVNILDDPSLPGAFGSYFFDHEGAIAAPTLIVENGIFRRGISDLMSASELDIARSANGRRQDVTRKAYARMSNTFFAAGESKLDDMIAGVDHGYLLQEFTHGMEDPKGWGIQVGAHVGREIRSGKLTGTLVSPVGITGYVPDVLGSVDAVSDDFSVGPGTCGKGFKEFVPVASGGPHLRLVARLS